MNRFRITLPDRLRELPDFTPPPGGWGRLVERLDGDRPRRRPRLAMPMALAASLLVAVTVALLVPRPPATVGAAPNHEVAQLMQQSQSLEQELQRVRPQVPVWNGHMAATAAHLRHDVALVDLQLSYTSARENPADAQRLWRDRVTLMSRLVQTHREATLTPVSYQVAVQESL
jgi:hypothetical protein